MFVVIQPNHPIAINTRAFHEELNIPVEVQFQLKCRTHYLEKNISCLGDIVELPVYVSRFAKCHSSVVATGKKGEAPGDLMHSLGAAIHDENHHIFVVNDFNRRVEIFSETGEFCSLLGVGQLSNPSSIAIHVDNVYISCLCEHTVSKFSLIAMCRVRRKGCKGSNNGQFKHPRGLATDLIGRVFIADCGNDKICIHGPDLNHLSNITL